jgi:D-glycero-alpha-D-manno-heptose 1-phosphate guanylyltransferase
MSNVDTNASARGISCVVLAGGKGTRLNNLYPDVPKPMIEVCGQPFLYWLVQWFQRQGLEQFIFSVGHKGDVIEEWLTHNTLLSPNSWSLYHEKQPLGTGGGVIACLSLCRDNILLTNGDSLLIAPLEETIRYFMDHPNVDAMIVGKSIDDTSRYASLDINDQGRLTGYYEKKPGKGLISTGIYLFRKRLLQALPADKPLSLEYSVIPQLIANGAHIQITVADAQAAFLDIGLPETIAQAPTFVRDNFKI